MGKQRTHSWLGLRGEKYNSLCAFKPKSSSKNQRKRKEMAKNNNTLEWERTRCQLSFRAEHPVCVGWDGRGSCPEKWGQGSLKGFL